VIENLDFTFIDEDLCTKCGGFCCRIYDPENRPKCKTISQWSSEFHEFKMEYGVKPLFDPKTIHQKENSHLREILRNKGIDILACEYLSLTGCSISREHRPSQCLAFRCKGWKGEQKKLYEKNGIQAI